MAAKKTAAQPLVPAEEQPYEIPQNWRWAYIRAGFEVTSSKRVHKEDWLTEGIPFYRTRELVKLSENGEVDNELFISEKQYEEFTAAYGKPKIGDLLISGVGTIGVPYVVEDNRKFYFKDGNIIWFQSNNLFYSRFIYYIYKSDFMYQQIHDMSAGTTVDTYTIINANNTKVPVPPLPEQHRIVDRIESLFAKLDEAREKAQSVVDGYEDRKAAILHKAFTGELTEGWREKNGITSFGSTEVLGEYATNQYGYTEKSSQEAIGPRFLRITDIQEGQVQWDTVPYCKISESDKIKYVLSNGDIVIARIGATTGKSYRVIDDVDAVYASYLIRVSIYKKDLLDSQYLYCFLQSPSYWEQISELSSGIALPGVNGKKLQTLKLPVPSLDEQHEIVRILDSLLAKEQQARDAAEQVLTQIEDMKKAVLAKAFRGELGTNVAEEKAVEI